VAGKRYFPYVSQSDQVINDLNGAFINKTRAIGRRFRNQGSSSDSAAQSEVDSS
jgi:hypothetical protein